LGARLICATDSGSSHYTYGKRIRQLLRALTLFMISTLPANA
jgi:hypothetical protein